MPRTYHVGLLAAGDTAVFQFCRSKDHLDCEILEYLGERMTTKAAAARRIRTDRPRILAQLQHDYPRKNFARVCIA